MWCAARVRRAVAFAASTAARTFSTDAASGTTAAQGSSAIGLALLAAPAAVTLGLGTWQMQRYNWKNGLIAFREQQLRAEPIPMSELHTMSAATPNSEFTRVRCEGTLDMANARFVGPRVKSVCGITKNGYLLIVPLRPADVAVPPVLLNRGWVPAEWRDAHAAGCWEVLGGAAPNVAQLAVLRDSETASSFVPDNTEQQWFWVDIPHLATSCGLPASTLLLDALQPEGSTPSLDQPPVSKSVAELKEFAVAPQGHLTYAATWYTLSAATTLMCYRFFRKPPPSRRSSPPPTPTMDR